MLPKRQINAKLKSSTRRALWMGRALFRCSTISLIPYAYDVWLDPGLQNVLLRPNS